jgi:hypothetical protein
MAPPRKRLGFLPRWRIFTYVILVLNLVVLVWLIREIATDHTYSGTCGNMSTQTCQNARDFGLVIGVAIAVFLWLLADLFLGLIWLLTRPRKRECPQCRFKTKRDEPRCSHCGFDVRATYPTMYPGQPMYPQLPSHNQ